jgi:hypothetical protein
MGLFDAAEAAMADLAARVAALEGGTVEPPVEPELTDSPCLVLWTGDDVDSLRITGTGRDGPDICINGSTNAHSIPIDGASVRRCFLQTAGYGIKIGSGAVAKNIVIADVTTRDCGDGILIAQVEDSLFERCDIEGGGTGHDHGVYLERGCHRLTWRNCRIKTCGEGYGLHCYSESDLVTDNLLFEDCVIDGGPHGQPLVIANEFAHITFRRCTFITSGGVCVRLGGCHDILFEDCDAEGGYAMIGTYANYWCSNVTVRRGSYRGPVILSPVTNEQCINNFVTEGVQVMA